MADVSRRMLALLSRLQDGRAWSGPDLARRLAVSPRTLRRDIDRLRQLGYPVRTRPGPGGHYRLVAGTAMPPLLLDDDEAVAVAIGLRMAAPAAGHGDPAEPDDDAAGRALRKLEQVLPSRLRRKVAAVHAATEAAPSPATVVPARLLSMLGAAVQQHERIRFTYRSRDGASTTRRVDPCRQVLTRHRWYLLAWDLDRADWRTFRLDRVTEAVNTGERFAPRELPAETAADYIDGALKAHRHRAVITFAAPIEQVADRLVSQDGTLEALDARRCRYTSWVDSFEWLAVTTTILGIDFRVDEPVEFTAYCRSLRDRLDRAAARRPGQP
jgi:predicted DNA-binding transcriptional regulator YafY